MTAPLNKTALDLTAPGLMQNRDYVPLDKFLKLHTPVVTSDANGNGDDHFKAANIETVPRQEGNHGYDVPNDEKVYDYHNDDIQQALNRTREAVRNMWASMPDKVQQTRDAEN